MGIKNLNKFIEEHCPNAFGRISIDSLSGYRLSIDASLWLYTRMKAISKTIIFAMNDPLEPINRKLIMKALCKALVNFIINWQNNRVTLVWCWDGEPVPEKLAVAKVER